MIRNKEKYIKQWRFNNFLSNNREWDLLTLTNRRLNCRHIKRIRYIKRVQHVIFDVPIEDVINVAVEKEYKMPAKLIIEIAVGQGLGFPKTTKRYKFDANKKVVHDFYYTIQKLSKNNKKYVSTVVS